MGGAGGGGISHPLGSLLEGGPRFYQLPDALQDREGRVAFVQVESSRPDTQRLQHTHSSHTQDDLLPQPLLDIADIEVMGYFAIPGLIALQVRVQQVERDPAHRHLPDRHVYRGIEERYADYDRITLPVQHWRDGVISAVQRLFDVFLPSILPDTLPDIALRVNQPHGDHRDRQVATLLEMIAS